MDIYRRLSSHLPHSVRILPQLVILNEGIKRYIGGLPCMHGIPDFLTPYGSEHDLQKDVHKYVQSYIPHTGSHTYVVLNDYNATCSLGLSKSQMCPK